VAHKFDPDHMEVLDRDERKKELPPKKSLIKIGLKAGQVVADIGSGTGFLTFPAADIVGPEGGVYAVETSERMLSELRSRIQLHGTDIVTPVLSREYDFTLRPESVHVVVMSNVFHEIDDKKRFAREMYRIVIPGGSAAVFEMKPHAEGTGPPKHHRVTPEEVAEAVEAAGFMKTKNIDISEKIYCIVCYR
jgi:ubiquinone/menaquinone biosynthesis C-methylase UbiE